MTLRLGKRIRFDFIVGIFRWFVFFFGFDFLFRFELRKVIDIFSSDHGAIGVEFELIVVSDSVDDLLYFVDSEFFDFVAVQEQLEFDEMIPGIGDEGTYWRRLPYRRINLEQDFRHSSSSRFVWRWQRYWTFRMRILLYL